MRTNFVWLALFMALHWSLDAQRAALPPAWLRCAMSGVMSANGFGVATTSGVANALDMCNLLGRIEFAGPSALDFTVQQRPDPVPEHSELLT